MAGQEDFASPNVTSGRTSREEQKSFLGLLSLAIFYFSLINNDIIRRLPQTPQSAGRDVP